MTEKLFEFKIKQKLYNLGAICTVKYEKDILGDEKLTIIAHSLNEKCLKMLRDNYKFGNNFRQRVDSYNPFTGLSSHHKPLYLYGFIKLSGDVE